MYDIYVRIGRPRYCVLKYQLECFAIAGLVFILLAGLLILHTVYIHYNRKLPYTNPTTITPANDNIHV